MYDPFKKIRKCQFCRKKNNLLLYIRRRGIYGEAGWFYAYHESCLRDIICEPEKYSHRLVDMAIEIIDLIEILKKEDQNRAERIQGNCERLKKYCI